MPAPHGHADGDPLGSLQATDTTVGLRKTPLAPQNADGRAGPDGSAERSTSACSSAGPSSSQIASRPRTAAVLRRRSRRYGSAGPNRESASTHRWSASSCRTRQRSPLRPPTRPGPDPGPTTPIFLGAGAQLAQTGARAPLRDARAASMFMRTIRTVSGETPTDLATVRREAPGCSLSASATRERTEALCTGRHLLSRPIHVRASS